MAKKPAVSDETLVRSLSAYAGMVDKVLTDPERWLGVDDDPDEPTQGLPQRALDAVRDRALGKVTPASDTWAEQPVEERVEWWVDRIAVGAGFAAATPRVAGALSDRLPLQDTLGAAAAGLAVCAVAREHGVTQPSQWVPLLSQVLFDRPLETNTAALPDPQDSEDKLLERDEDEEPHPGNVLAALGRGARHSAQTLWRLARTFLGIQDLLDERPRGGFLARTLAKVPVVGVAGGWLDERGAIHKAAKETATLLA